MRVSCFLRAARVDIAFVRRLFIAASKTRARSSRAANYANLCIQLYNRTLLPKNFVSGRGRTEMHIRSVTRKKKKEETLQRADLRRRKTSTV